MPRDDQSKDTNKEQRQAEHIESSCKKSVSKIETQSCAWATVNKESGGGKKSKRSGRR